MMQISRSVCPFHLRRVIKIHEDILVSNASLPLSSNTLQEPTVTKINVPSPLGIILLLLKRKRPHLYGEMGHFQHLPIHFSRAPGRSNAQHLLFWSPGPCLIKWYGCCAFDLRIGYKNILVNLDDAPKVERTYRSGDLHHERAQRATYSSETLENGSG